jgi:hypothetical protein
VLDVNGIKIGITSVDVTQHLADSEFCMWVIIVIYFHPNMSVL